MLTVARLHGRDSLAPVFEALLELANVIREGTLRVSASVRLPDAYDPAKLWPRREDRRRT